MTPVVPEVLSLADVALPAPIQDGRDERERAHVSAALISSRTGLPTVAVARSFTIDPMFEWSPDPALLHTRDYPTWSWPIPPRESAGEVIKAVNAAGRKLSNHGYCGPRDRGVYFLTMLCFMAPEGEPRFFQAWCYGQFFPSADAMTEGRIDFAKCLFPPSHIRALAYLPSATRASLSDFRKAVQLFAAWLTSPG